jgi:hypothetical protein
LLPIAGVVALLATGFPRPVKAQPSSGSTAAALEGPWHDVFWSDYSTPPEACHGCMIELGRAEWESLSAAYDGPSGGGPEQK